MSNGVVDRELKGDRGLLQCRKEFRAWSEAVALSALGTPHAHRERPPDANKEASRGHENENKNFGNKASSRGKLENAALLAPRPITEGPTTAKERNC
jgi:hypothetical protein